MRHVLVSVNRAKNSDLSGSCAPQRVGCVARLMGDHGPNLGMQPRLHWKQRNADTLSKRS